MAVGTRVCSFRKAALSPVLDLYLEDCLLQPPGAR
jgi:hypothetical protein